MTLPLPSATVGTEPAPRPTEGMTICPLGFCTFEQVCPRAPCVDCMRRLRDHMVEELLVLREQAGVAQRSGDTRAYGVLHGLLESVSVSVNQRLTKQRESA